MATETAPKPSLEREFAESTSLHGIARVFNATRLIVKLIWISIMLSCLCVCILQISDRFQRFFEFKASTEISVEYVRDLDFPAVTICNFNRYRLSALTESDKTCLSYIIWANDYDYDSYGASQVHFDYPTHWDGPMEDGTNNTSFNYTEFTLRAGFLMDELTLRQCEWRRKTKSCFPANFSHVFTSFGNCWTFNSGTMGTILKESQAGSGNGVRMLIDIQQNQYTETVDGNIPAGLKVLVHGPRDPTFSRIIGAGHLARRYLNLEPPYGKCNASKTLTRYDHYTAEGCNIECRAQVILDKCNCRLVRKNVILLDVFYEDINFEKYEQSEAITPSALISDIGGQLGLFLGASFITLAEVLSFLGKKIDFWIHRGLNKNKRHSDRANDYKNKDVPLKSIRVDNRNQTTLLSDV